MNEERFRSARTLYVSADARPLRQDAARLHSCFLYLNGAGDAPLARFTASSRDQLGPLLSEIE